MTKVLTAAMAAAIAVALMFACWLLAPSLWTGVPVESTVCPPSFDASMILIEQRRQSVVCVYDDRVLQSETVHERGR